MTDWNIQREGIGHASASNLKTDPIESLTNLCPPVEKIAGPVSFSPVCLCSFPSSPSIRSNEQIDNVRQFLKVSRARFYDCH